MPIETQAAVDWALQQSITDDYGFTHPVKDENGNVVSYLLVDFVRQYFNEHEIEYSNFSYYDLVPYL